MTHFQKPIASGVAVAILIVAMSASVSAKGGGGSSKSNKPGHPPPPVFWKVLQPGVQSEVVALSPADQWLMPPAPLRAIVASRFATKKCRQSDCRQTARATALNAFMATILYRLSNKMTGIAPDPHDVTGKLEEGIALALSGGGYRAMVFHLGALLRLNEVGFLSKLTRVSSVSGGSITAGALAMSGKSYASTMVFSTTCRSLSIACAP